ncbi:MAG TPA: ABC transporter substrate-binding protein [Candidatus Kapabacteria bacterium]|nr:ABC transporter substrate-binding protein [Candidatus Kapabacteria bacterium]
MKPTIVRTAASLRSIALVVALFVLPMQAHAQSDPERITMLEPAGPFTLNPFTLADATALEIQGYVFEPLIAVDPATLQNIPWLAEELPVRSADGLHYDITLRQGIHFSDGHALTGEDVVFTLKAIKNRHIADAAPIREYFSNVADAELIGGDPYHIRFTVFKPTAYDAQLIGSMWVCPRHIWDPANESRNCTFLLLNSDASTGPIEHVAQSIRDSSKGLAARYLIGSGPYRIASTGFNQDILLQRDSTYWNRAHPLGAVHARSLAWHFEPDPAAAFAMLEQGTADLIALTDKVQLFEHEKELAARGIARIDYAYPSYTFIGWQCENPLFSDARVRNALSMALDRDTIIQQVYHGMAHAIQSPVLRERPECDTTLPLIRRNQARARVLLAEAGWQDSDHDGILDKVIKGKRIPFRFGIMVNAGNARRLGSAQMAARFFSQLGIDAQVTPVEWSVFLERQRNHDFEAFIGGWAMQEAEMDLHSIWHSASIDSGSNVVRYRNNELDALLDSIAREPDFSRRIPLYRRAQQIIHRDQPYTFLVRETMTALYRDRFTNVRTYALQIPVLPAFWQIASGGR